MLLVIEPLTICTDCPRETVGPASTSKPSKEGASNVLSSGIASKENSTRNASPIGTIMGALALKVTGSAPNAPPAARSAARRLINLT